MILINKRECVLTILWALSITPTGALARDVHFDVEVDRALSTLDVTVRSSEPFDHLAARSRSAPRYLDTYRDCSPAASENLRVNGRGLEGESLTCVEYRIDLAALARNERRNASLDRRNVLVAPSKWLWQPRVAASGNLTVNFTLPDGMRVSPPWQPVGESGRRFRIPSSPENASAAVAIGDFVEESYSIPGANLRIAVMKPRGDNAPAHLAEWVASAATNVSYAYGAFPNPGPHAVVVPVGGSRNSRKSPVPFGRVIRDGGETVEFYVNENAALERFHDDWTATHEFSHLMLPYVTSKQRWISEGFAQYFQNVLMARAGTYSSQRAFQKLYEGFERGRRARPELSPNAAASGRERGATMKVYWSGAVLALMADVELRRSSGGSQSLDSILDELRGCCLPSDRTWGGTELLSMLDDLAGRDVFMPLYRRYANTAGFPDYTGVFAELGVEIVRGRVEFDDAAPLAGVRATLVEPAVNIKSAQSGAAGGAALLE